MAPQLFRMVTPGRAVVESHGPAIKGWAAAWPRVILGCCVAAMGIAAGVLTLLSLRWPLIGDTVFMQYIAARILDGATPYRDLFDMNFPGVYLFHLLAIWLLGYGDGAVRVLDLAVLGGIVVGLGVALGHFGRWPAVTGALLFWLYHVTGGATEAMQRDFLLCLPMAWTLACVAIYSRTCRATHLALASLAAGIAITVKPLAILLVPVLFGFAWIARTERRLGLLAITAVCIGAPMVVIVTWLWLVGGLTAFVDIVGGYLPLYAEFGRASLTYILGRPAVLVLTPWAIAGFVLLRRIGRADSSVVMLAAGVTFGVLNLVLQGKGFGYHAYPLVMFAGALGAAGLSATWYFRGWTVLFLGLLVAMNVGLARRSIRYYEVARLDRDLARVAAVARIVGPIVTLGRPVQVFDTVVGGLHALYRLRTPQATRFLYDLHFFHHVGHPYIHALRAQLIQQLHISRPGVVVVFRYDPPAGDYTRIAEFPELGKWLMDGYHFVYEGDAFRVFVAKDMSRPPD
jgi:hypothetical protein